MRGGGEIESESEKGRGVQKGRGGFKGEGGGGELGYREGEVLTPPLMKPRGPPL